MKGRMWHSQVFREGKDVLWIVHSETVFPVRDCDLPSKVYTVERIEGSSRVVAGTFADEHAEDSVFIDTITHAFRFTGEGGLEVKRTETRKERGSHPKETSRVTTIFRWNGRAFVPEHG